MLVEWSDVAPVSVTDVLQHHPPPPPSHRPPLKCSALFCISMELWENLRATNKNEQQCILHVSEERKSGQWASLCEKRPLANLWGPLNQSHTQLRWARTQQTAAETPQRTSEDAAGSSETKQILIYFTLSFWWNLFKKKTKTKKNTHIWWLGQMWKENWVT